MAVIDMLTSDPLVKLAARVGKMFQIDPVLILDDGGDPLLNQIRVAAAQIVQKDEEEQAAKARASGRRRR